MYIIYLSISHNIIQVRQEKQQQQTHNFLWDSWMTLRFIPTVQNITMQPLVSIVLFCTCTTKIFPSIVSIHTSVLVSVCDGKKVQYSSNYLWYYSFISQFIWVSARFCCFWIYETKIYNNNNNLTWWLTNV